MKTKFVPKIGEIYKVIRSRDCISVDDNRDYCLVEGDIVMVVDIIKNNKSTIENCKFKYDFNNVHIIYSFKHKIKLLSHVLYGKDLFVDSESIFNSNFEEIYENK